MSPPPPSFCTILGYWVQGTRRVGSSVLVSKPHLQEGQRDDRWEGNAEGSDRAQAAVPSSLSLHATRDKVHQGQNPAFLLRGV